MTFLVLVFGESCPKPISRQKSQSIQTFKRPEAYLRAWIDGEMTTVFRAIKVINSFVENKGDCSGRFLIRIETDTGVFKVSSIFVKNYI